MYFDFSALASPIIYKLLTSTVTPRPIAWVTTMSNEGIVNAAPFSFFNAMGHQPPTVALGLLQHPKGRLKDTPANILANGEFVVNLVSEAMGTQMNQTCADYPPEADELQQAGLTAVPAKHVRPPLIQGCPVALECTSLHTMETGPNQVIVIGRVLAAHIDDRFIINAERGYIDTPQLGLIARMHGSGWYARCTDLFQMERPVLGDDAGRKI